MNGPKKFIPSRPVHPASKEPPIEMVENPMPKVAICIPSGDTVHKGFAMSLAAMTYMCGPHNGMPAIPIALCGVEGSLIVRNRNFAILEAQKLGVDYVLFLDSDLIFPQFTLRRLLAHGKDIVGATYLQREEPHHLLGVWEEGAALTSDKLHSVLALPGGCILVKMSVFDGMVQPYYRTPSFEATPEHPAHIQGEDYYFCEQARKLGHEVLLDVPLSMQLGHIGRQVVRIPAAQVQADEPANDAGGTDGQAAAIIH